MRNSEVILKSWERNKGEDKSIDSHRVENPGEGVKYSAKISG